jgi:hypothetical protein
VIAGENTLTPAHPLVQAVDGTQVSGHVANQEMTIP